MPSSDRSQADLFELWFAVHNETATDEQIQNLNRQIVESDEVRTQLHDLANQQAWLMWHAAKTGESILADRQAGDESLAGTLAPTEADQHPAIDSRSAEPVVFPAAGEPGSPFSQAVFGWLPYFGVVLAIAAGGLLALLAIGRRDAAQNPPSQAPPTQFASDETNLTNKAGDPLAHRPIPGDAAAQITSVWDPQWSTKGSHRNGDLLKPGERLELTGGLAEITFGCGAVVILQPPVVFEVRAPNGAWLESGNLTARVPGPSANFWVTTPKMKVVDLGTEFGLSADATGASRVLVFEGSVEVEPLESKAAKRNRDAGVRKTIMAGQSGVVDPSLGYSEMPADSEPGAFVRDMPNSLVDDYSRAIKSSRPWGYWDFNSLASSTLVPDISGHGRFAQLLNDAMIVQGNSIQAIGQAVSLNGVNDSVVIPTGSTISMQKDFSWEVLFRTTVGGVLMSKSPADGSWQSGSKMLFVRGGEVRFTAFDSKSAKRHRLLSGKDMINDNRWHHVVVVNEANVAGGRDRTTLYIDGVPRTRRDDWEITTDADRRMPIKLGVASTAFPADDIKTATYFPTFTHLAGNIDEAAVYDRCLTGAEVAAHYRAFLSVGISRRSLVQSQSLPIEVESDEEGSND